MLVKFSPKGGIQSLIISWILNAKKEVLVAAYSFTNPDIANAIIIAKNHGCDVYVVMDKSQTYGVQAKLHDVMVKAGITVELCGPRKEHGLKSLTMHNKFLIVDGEKVQTGSYNYTVNAENNNFENAIFFVDPNAKREYKVEFTYLMLHSWKERKFGKRLERMVRRLRA
jgi:phosphatidylserine/phosphatidylglycerophosphate/cardiolipin synthase-like enzyme